MMRFSAYALMTAATVFFVALAGGCSSRGDSSSPVGSTPSEQGTQQTADTARQETSVTEKTPQSNPAVVIETSMGQIKAELFADKAPKTVANFLQYVDKGFFDGLIFHRVISGFMIQGGGMKPDMTQPATASPVVNEASPDVPNLRGTLAMARTNDPHSATAQFFINLKDNDFLNQTSKDARGYGYAVFGKVTAGMDVVDKIAAVRTGRSGYHDDVPVEPVLIKSIRRAE